jgi:hypothetical protein
MAVSEEAHLLELWGKRICPFCAKTIPNGGYVGSGKKSEGGFCSLDCFAKYYEIELIERAKRVAALAQRHRAS